MTPAQPIAASAMEGGGAADIDLAKHRSMANALRALAMDAVAAAQSGHPGMPMGMADAAIVLWTRFLRHNPADQGLGARTLMIPYQPELAFEERVVTDPGRGAAHAVDGTAGPHRPRGRRRPS
jgi:hypothetical protein